MVRKLLFGLSIIVGGAFIANAGTVSGTVSANAAAGGAVIAGAVVTLAPTAGGGTTYVDTTSAAGAFDFAAVATGAYRLTAAATGYTTSAAFAVAVTATSATVHNFTLAAAPAGVTVSGAVTDATTGGAVVGAVVRLRTGATAAVVESTTTIAGGAYTLTAVQAGEYNLNISATGYTTQTTAEFAVAEANIVRNIALAEVPPGVTVSGSVTNATTGAAIVGAVVRIRTGATAAVVESTTTITGGAYTLTAVQAGEYNLNISATGFTTQTTAEFAVAEANIVRNIALAVAPVVTVSGYVTDTGSGAVIVGASVLLENGTTVVDSTVTLTTGAYTLTGVTAGTYNLVVSAAGYATKTTVLTVAAVNITGENIRIVKSTAVIPVAGAADPERPDVSLTPSGTLHLVNCTKAGRVNLFSVDGKCVYRTTFGAMANSVAVPRGIVHAGSAYIVSVTQGSSVYRKRVMVF
jgi:hypothetical protein